jgi:hypothetical protein
VVALILGFTQSDTIRLSGIAAFTSVADVAGSLFQEGTSVVLDMGYTVDHPDIYNQYTPLSHLGRITFLGTSVSDLLTAGWEFV